MARFIDRQFLERLRLHGWTFLRDSVVISLAYATALVIRFDGPVPVSSRYGLLVSLPFIVLVYNVFNYSLGVHRRIWQYAGIRDVRALMLTTGLALLLIGAIDVIIPRNRPLPVSTVPTGGALCFLGLIAVRLWPRILFHAAGGKQEDQSRMLIVGAGEAGQVVAADLLNNVQWGIQPVGFLDDDPRKQKRRIHGIPILGTIAVLPELVKAHNVDIVGIAIASASTSELNRILSLVQPTDARIQILPTRAELLSQGGAMRLRDINLNDLLGRLPSAGLDQEQVRGLFSGRVVLVTGGAGSIGSELCRQILALEPDRVVAVDNNETGLFYLQRELAGVAGGARLTPILANITDAGKMSAVFARYQPDIVFHAAAYKHVPMLEAFPEEAAFVNVSGTLILCRLALEHQCRRFVFISTDKAVRPTSVLGFSKRIGELLTRAHQDGETVFCSVRFGNVIGSRGSALPEFVRQIDAGGPVTVTHPDVERYFMTIPEASSLVIQAGSFARGGELYMLDMGAPIKLLDLVKRIIRLRGLRAGTDIDIIFTGLRPGEKLTEELLFDEEATRSTANPSIYVVEDRDQPGAPGALRALEQHIGVLLQVAERGESDRLRELLAQVANHEWVTVKRQIGTVS